MQFQALIFVLIYDSDQIVELFDFFPRFLRRTKHVVQIFFAGRRTGRVHGLEQRVHIQIVPGDIIHNIMAFFMVLIVVGNVCQIIRPVVARTEISVLCFEFRYAVFPVVFRLFDAKIKKIDEHGHNSEYDIQRRIVAVFRC